MNKTEFINSLKSKITDMPYQEVEKTINYYAEIIDDRIEEGINEEEAVEALGNIDEIVREIRMDIPLSSLISQKVKQSHDKASNKTLWMILAIVGFPFWLPLSIAFAAVVFSVYITIWAVVFSLFAVVLSLGLAAVAGFVGGVIQCFSAGFPQGMFFVGLSICIAGLFIMSFRPMLWLCKKIAKLTCIFFRYVKSLFVSKEATK